jgi:hypothetical protein
VATPVIDGATSAYMPGQTHTPNKVRHPDRDMHPPSQTYNFSVNSADSSEPLQSPEFDRLVIFIGDGFEVYTIVSGASSGHRWTSL